MKVLSKWQLLFLANVFTFSACGNTTAENGQSNASSDVQNKTKSIQQETSKTSNSAVRAELNKARKAGKAVFLVVTGTGVTDTEKAISVAKEANAIYKNAVVLQMNRDDDANAALVAEWRLSGAPLPLILVLSSKGQPTGGYVLSDATPENIAALVPSPKLEEVYAAIGNDKHAIVVFSKKSFTDQAEVVKIAKEAVSTLKEAVLVEVDMDNGKEKGFMRQLRVNPSTAESSVTIVINKQGQVAGISTTMPDAGKLVTAAKTPVRGGCGPGCGPAGCGQ